MISAKKDGLENVNCQNKYDGVLNIDVINHGIGKTMLNSVSCCGDEAIKSTSPSSRIKLEYFNISRRERLSHLDNQGKCIASYEDTINKLSNINGNYKSRLSTEQTLNKYENIRVNNSLAIGQSENRVQSHSESISKSIEAREKKVNDEVGNTSNYSNEKEGNKAMERGKINIKDRSFQVRKAHYLRLIGNHAYLNKFDREQKRNCSRDLHVSKIKSSNGSAQEISRRIIINQQIENMKSGFKSSSEQLTMLDESLNDHFSKAHEKTARNFDKPVHIGKLPKNIKMNNEKPNAVFPHSPESFQAINRQSNHNLQSEQKNNMEKNPTSYQTRYDKIISSSSSSSNTSISDDDTNSLKQKIDLKNEGYNGSALEKCQSAGKRGEGDCNLVSNSNNLSVKILLPLRESRNHSSKSRAGKCIKSLKLQNKLKDKLENDSQRKQQTVEREHQLYYNFLLPENNFIEKCFGGTTENATSQNIQNPAIQRENSSNTNTVIQRDSLHTNQDFSSESTTRVEFMSVHKRRSRNRNSKPKGSHQGEREKKKVYPGNIVKMREDETPCEYLNQFSSILIDNLKDPIPKDPLNLPSACNVYVPVREHPIPLEQYAKHYISTSNFTVTSETLSEASDSKSQSIKTSKSIIILKKISELTKISDDKNKTKKCLKEKTIEKGKYNKRLHRQSDQSFVERPCCCFIQ
ncbi:uncharacterized protein LOC111050438 [Nilaparvata lugens]|uniref:uncharacterized protein LOC111050438 n=1 Tax=Nilaparvata lugens TaxID=108931 RepID=UPI000B986C19|nr:uncharacterized protein LOC111050438 [Nilaparvata lugens]